jgi:hypothetical protein
MTVAEYVQEPVAAMDSRKIRFVEVIVEDVHVESPWRFEIEQEEPYWD